MMLRRSISGIDLHEVLRDDPGIQLFRFQFGDALVQRQKQLFGAVPVLGQDDLDILAHYGTIRHAERFRQAGLRNRQPAFQRVGIQNKLALPMPPYGLIENST